MPDSHHERANNAPLTDDSIRTDSSPTQEFNAASQKKRVWEPLPAGVGGFLGATIAGVALPGSFGVGAVAALGYFALQHFVAPRLKL